MRSKHFWRLWRPISAQNACLTEHDGIIERKEDRIIRLEKLLADFKRALYGAKSEKAIKISTTSR
jgi:hypothetical protein